MGGGVAHSKLGRRGGVSHRKRGRGVLTESGSVCVCVGGGGGGRCS